MSKENLLFVCGNIMPYSSQGIRYVNLLNELSEHFNITLLSYNYFCENQNIKTVSIISKSETNNELQNLKTKNNFLKSVYKSFLRPFIFPDRYRYALGKYQAKISNQFNKVSYQKVIIGMTPFSLYELAPFLRENYNVEIIYDLSDPFSFNGKNDYAFIYNQKFLKRYEKKYLGFVDKVVVLNPTLKKLYTELFNHKKVFVIEQGLQKSFYTWSSSIKDNKELQLIYAGGLYKKLREAFELYKAIDSFNGDIKLDIYGNIKSELLPNSKYCFYKGVIDTNSLQKEYQNSECIVFIDNTTGYQVPGKILEVQEVGKPILFINSNPDSRTFDYLFNDNIIQVKNNQSDIINGITQLKSIKGQSSRSTKLDEFYWENLGKKYKELLYD